MNRPPQDDEALLRQLDRLAHLLDEQFAVPGTRWRVGLDSLIGLIPGIGDAVTTGFALYLFAQARRLGLPRHVQVRMLANIGLDALVGSVPIAGDLFDVAFKANRRNLDLLRRHLVKQKRRSR